MDTYLKFKGLDNVFKRKSHWDIPTETKGIKLIKYELTEEQKKEMFNDINNSIINCHEYNKRQELYKKYILGDNYDSN